MENKLKNIQFQPREVLNGESYDTYEEIVDAIREAERTNRRIKPVGSLWSQTDIIYTDETLLNMSGAKIVFGLYSGDNSYRMLRGNNSILNANVRASNRKFAWVQTGVTVNELYTILDNKENDDYIRPPWALFSMGSSSGQTIGGLISTSSHGGDFNRHPISDDVYAIRIITTGGADYWIEPKNDFVTDRNTVLGMTNISSTNFIRNDDWFNTILVSMGSIGVIVEILIEVTEQYGLSQKKLGMSWDRLIFLITSEHSRNNTGLFSTVPLPELGHPTVVRGFQTEPISQSFEILINPYRVSDNYTSDNTPLYRPPNCQTKSS